MPFLDSGALKRQGWLDNVCVLTKRQARRTVPGTQYDRSAPAVTQVRVDEHSMEAEVAPSD